MPSTVMLPQEVDGKRLCSTSLLFIVSDPKYYFDCAEFRAKSEHGANQLFNHKMLGSTTGINIV